MKKNKILNSIISYENIGKICTFKGCKTLASIIINDRAKGLKSILCMKHAKLTVAVNDIFDEENDGFVIKLYHPYLVSITCEMDHLPGSLYRIESSLYQHDTNMNESETEKMKSIEKVKRINLESEWEPVFRLDIERNDSYSMSGQKVHCINGVRRYVTDCSHSELNTNVHTFGSIATVMCTKCVIHALKTQTITCCKNILECLCKNMEEFLCCKYFEFFKIKWWR